MPSFSNKINVIVLLTDLILISVCLITTGIIFKFNGGLHITTLDIVLWTYLITGWYFTSKDNHLYDDFPSNNIVTEVFKTLKNVFLQALFISLFLFVVKYPLYNRTFAFTYVGLLLFFLPLQKMLFKRIYIHFIKKSANRRNILIIGAGNVGKRFYNMIVSKPYLGYNFIGFLDDVPQKLPKGQYLGTIDKLRELLKMNTLIDEIVVALPNTAVAKVTQILKIANNETVRVKIIPDFFHIISSKYGIGMVGGMPIITVRSEPLEEYHWQLMKRLFDLLFTILILIIVCSWLFPLIAIIIKLDSKGPVFFTQLRSGRNNIPFNCIKFRSMVVNQHANAIQATKDDTRLTNVGKFLRVSNLDELPQFFNVLMGDMSVIGPRPHMIRHTEQYSRVVEGYLVRQLLKPGISGWAQVNGHRGETKYVFQMQKRIEYDLVYLENWSLGFDLKIIFLTIWNTVKGDPRAY
ncbi:MAG: undecaprenyl-phosphate glucose phosphotransferase [Sphingobacteriales bacterium]|nr:undecaprenyl-phosphate glucose phosphotransferase [Sphingobacteriales bacterium]